MKNKNYVVIHTEKISKRIKKLSINLTEKEAIVFNQDVKRFHNKTKIVTIEIANKLILYNDIKLLYNEIQLKNKELNKLKREYKKC